MTLPRETLIELMALADGELDGEARARAESLAASNDEARRALDAMRGHGDRVRRWLRESAEDRYAAARADDIAQGVMARLGAPNAVTVAPAVRVTRPRGRPRPPWTWAAAGAAIALAACLALYVRGHASSGDVAAGARPSNTGNGDIGGAQGERAPELRVASGVEVDDIDAPAQRVSVFEIPGGGAAAAAGIAHPSSVVVWIDDSAGSR